MVLAYPLSLASDSPIVYKIGFPIDDGCLRIGRGSKVTLYSSREPLSEFWLVIPLLSNWSLSESSKVG